MSDIAGEFLERNRRLAYPLVDGTHVFLAPNDSYSVNELLLDAHLTFVPPTSASTWQIKSIHAATLAVELFDPSTGSTAALGAPNINTLLASSYRCLQWNAADLALVLVLAAEHPALGAATTLVLAAPAALAPRCHERQPRRVNALRTGAGDLWIDLGDTGELLEGTNIRLEVDPDIPLIAARKITQSSGRPSVRRIVISAVPGAGAGRAESGACAPVAGSVFSIAGQPGVDGNFNLSGDGCYLVQRDYSGSTPLEAALRLRNDCSACCDCDDFVDLLEAIRDVKNYALQVKEVLGSALAAYKDVIASWQAQTACAPGCTVQLYAYAYTGWLITVQVWIGNRQSCMASGGRVSFSFSGGSFDPEYVAGTGMIYNSQDKYFQSDPSLSGGAFVMEDNTGIPAGAFRVFTMTVRMRASTDRVDGNDVDVSAVILACGADSSHSTTVKLISNKVRT